MAGVNKHSAGCECCRRMCDSCAAVHTTLYLRTPGPVDHELTYSEEYDAWWAAEPLGPSYNDSVRWLIAWCNSGTSGGPAYRAVVFIRGYYTTMPNTYHLVADDVANIPWPSPVPVDWSYINPPDTLTGFSYIGASPLTTGSLTTCSPFLFQFNSQILPNVSGTGFGGLVEFGAWFE